MHYLQVYRVDTAIPPLPRWVENVSAEPVELMYNSQSYTLKPGEVLYTDLAVANIFVQQCIKYETSETSGLVRSVGNHLKIHDKEPSIDGGKDVRVSGLSAQVETPVSNETVPAVTVDENTPMPAVRAAASAAGVKWVATDKKVKILEMLKAKLAE